MNILFFSRLFNPHIGGVEKHIAEISKILMKKGHKVTLITEQYSKDLKEIENIEGINAVRIPNLKEGKIKKFEIWKWLWRNRKLIKEADIVHCHDVFFWYLPFRFIFPSKKIFTTFHGYECYPLKVSSVIMHRISEKLSMGNICVGNFIKKWYGTKTDFVTYGAVGNQNVKERSVNVKKESAIFVGRLDEQTGILTYVNAIKILRKKYLDFEFLIVGDGKFRNQIDKKMKIVKPLKNADEYFYNYNFAFVSRYLSMMEAMAAKRLVFAVYDNPLKEDYLRMTPFSKYIVISNSQSELASKITYYLENLKAKDEMIKGAYSWVRKNTWEEMVNMYLRLWKT
jgi:glycosyltransferase involved in cell wall biosynthesis